MKDFKIGDLQSRRRQNIYTVEGDDYYGVYEDAIGIKDIRAKVFTHRSLGNSAPYTFADMSGDCRRALGWFGS